MNNLEDILVKLYEKKLHLDSNFIEGKKKEKLEGYVDVIEEARKQVIKYKDPKLEELFKKYFYDLLISIHLFHY